MTKPTTLAALAVATLIAGGCGDDTPTSPTATATTPFTELFAGTLAPRGSAFYSYAVQAPGGEVAITLASVTMGAARTAASTELLLGVGLPSGESCASTQTLGASAALVAQLVPTQPAGTYCVSVADAGTLTGSVNFAVRIVHP